MTPKRTPTRRKATGNRDAMAGPPPAVPHNWPDTGMMPEPERVPTGSGELQPRRSASPRTRGQVSADFRAAVSALWSGEVEAESAACPPGDGGGGREVGAAKDG